MNDTMASSGVIVQRRPSVIQEVPRPETTVDEGEHEMIDVVGDGLEEVEEREGKRESSPEVGRSRRTKRKRMEHADENGICTDDDDWKVLGRNDLW